MRQDARSLLERLSRRDFRYQEFEDAYADIELWPLFEALLSDERVVGRRAALRGAEVEVRSRASLQDDAPPARAPSPFGRHSGAAGPARSKVVNMRSFLAQLSDRD